MNSKLFLKLVIFAIVVLSAANAVAQNAPAAPGDCRPGISFGSLIGSVKVGFNDGRLNVDKLYAICLPMPAKQSDSNYPYNPDNGGKLSMNVKTADGRTLNTYVWSAERFGNLWEVSQYKVIGGYEAVKPLGVGSFVLEFAADDKPFYRFPFSVVAVQSDDPYQPPGNRYFIEGAWNEYGNLFYQRNDPQSSLSFTTWVQAKSTKDEKRSIPYELKLIRSKDNKVLAEDKATLRMQPNWLKAEFLLRPTDGDGNSYFKAGELLREDGAYCIRFTIDGKLYGEYAFTIKGGRIQFQGRQVRENTDPMIYIVDYMYGGKYSSWWIKRDGALR